MANQVNSDHEGDGVDRRGFLKCMAWAGTGVVWSVSGGVLSSRVFGNKKVDASRTGSFSFVQISDSHIGFAKEANKNVIGTLQATVDKINALKERPDLLIHTGDLTHLSTPKEFDTVAEILRGAKVKYIAYVPGEHDLIGDLRSIWNDSARGPRARAGTASTFGECISSASSTSQARGPTKGLESWGRSSWTGSRRTSLR